MKILITHFQYSNLKTACFRSSCTASNKEQHSEYFPYSILSLYIHALKYGIDTVFKVMVHLLLDAPMHYFVYHLIFLYMFIIDIWIPNCINIKSYKHDLMQKKLSRYEKRILSQNVFDRCTP